MQKTFLLKETFLLASDLLAAFVKMMWKANESLTANNTRFRHHRLMREVNVNTTFGPFIRTFLQSESNSSNPTYPVLIV